MNTGQTIPKEMKQNGDRADACEEAHERTIRDCAAQGINVDCTGPADCGDDGHDHESDGMTHYGSKAQDIFNSHYDHICDLKGI